MNVERILALADLIEKQPHTSTAAKDGFCMAAYMHTCGTPACIAGFAVHAFGKSKSRSTFIDAARLLGIKEGRADELFYAVDWRHSVSPYVRLRDITPSHAAAVLRHLAKTREVNWEVGAPASVEG